jgi:hypothetical protein
MSVIDLEAIKKWNKIPKNLQVLIINNVFCSTCLTTTVVEYSIKNDIYGVLIEGKCKKCGKDVARLVEV